MRFGWLVALTAIVLSVGQAQAADYTIYEYGGTGIRQNTKDGGVSVGDPETVGFFGTFSVLTRPSQPGFGTSNGSVFRYYSSLAAVFPN